MDLATCTITDFEPLVGQPFEVRVPGLAPLPVTLERVRAGRDTPSGRASFSLFFLFPRQLPVAQGLWTLHHAATGALELFLVPVGQSDAGVRYEAVFG